MTLPKSATTRERITNANAKLHAAREALARDDTGPNPQLVIYWYNHRQELLDQWNAERGGD